MNSLKNKTELNNAKTHFISAFFIYIESPRQAAEDFLLGGLKLAVFDDVEIFVHVVEEFFDG